MASDQNEYGLPIGKGEKRRTARLLPRYYRTEPNKKFIQATLDQLTQSGTVKKLNGYVGRQNAKAVTGSDVFIETVTTDRQNYQLEPSAVVKDTLGNVTFFKDYIDYINTVDVLGGVNKNHQILNKQEFYSWNPHINWDKFVNFQQYYWMPYGPEPVKVAGQQKTIVSTYKVVLSDEGDNRAYLFTPDGLTRNPSLKLFRGQTYKFEITAPGEPFSIKTQRVQGTLYRYTNGLSKNAVDNGVIEFTIPEDAPDVLYYVSENSVDTGGAFEIFDVEENTFIDVDAEIVGKKTYKLGSGLELSNGMKLVFTGEVQPAKYSQGAYYVDGVGSEIKLIAESSLQIITSYSEASEVLFDDSGFDTLPFSDATSYAAQKDYITINRTNSDGNPWSRYNRWFHQDVITKSAEAAGLQPTLDQAQRATRPIIEFESNLKLFNFGTQAKLDVDLVDNFTKDIFSTIEGSIGYNIDGVTVTQGQRILFTADTDLRANNRIYKVDFITVTPTNGNPVRQIHLVEETDSDPLLNETVLVKNGLLNQGRIYWFNGSSWKVAQEKLLINQSPLFDLFDENEVSLNDSVEYEGSTFAGNKIFSYKVGSGSNDTVLGFPLTYRNINNIGDIVFTFDLLQNNFSYKKGVDVITETTDSKFLKLISGRETGTFINGWSKNNLNNTQPVVRVFKDTGITKEFSVDVYDNINDLDDLEVRVYVNGRRLSKDKWELVDSPKYKKVVLDTAVQLTDVVTLRCFSSQDKNSKGYYELPVNLQNNPLNNNINTFTLGEVIDHVDSIIDNNPEFNGTYPGSGNLRDLSNLSTYGTKFVQHSGPLNLGLYHLTNKNSNVIKALKQARDDYGKFKRNFITVSQSLTDNDDIKVFVDNILFEINKNKPKSSPYYFSDMIGYGGAVKTDYEVVDYRIKTYPLSEVFSLNGLSNKSVNVYVNDVQLLYGKDYTFNDTGFVELTETSPLSNGDIITVYEYESTDGCFIPATPTSLGMWPKYEPKKYLDTTLVTPREVIQGHDGSLILAYGDYRDNLILELEKRIFNNIKVEYDPTIFDILDFIPGYNRNTDYSLDEFNKVLAPNFYQWTQLIDRDFTKPLSYDQANPFTYNYHDNFAPDGRPLPGYWRGIYTWMFDTDRVHLCPWESLGYTLEPSWWQDVYGPAPYTSDNYVLWEDLKNGVIKEPGKPPTRIEKFARPVLAVQPPVDEAGNLLAPIAANIAQGDFKPQLNNDFVFGDYSPVEAAWRRSSFYAFSVLITAILLQPNKVLGLCLDRSRIVKNKSNQLVYKDTNLRLKLSDLVLPSIPSDNARIQTAGLVNYIVDYILSDNLKSLDEYKNDLTYLTNQLSHRLGGFTSKEKFKLLLDSKSPVANAGVFVPEENYTIFLNTSSPTKKLNYSGVIVTKVLSRTGVGYEVKGYSQLTPFFYYYPWTQSGNTINVGGISESYIDWTSGQQYIAGNIVRYNNAFYRVKTNHTAQSNFNADFYQRLPKLPIIGGRDATLRKAWDRTPTIINYGTTFSSVQEVVDFLQGYGEYLKDQGFIFDDYNTNLKAISSWETSIKEFMFWTTQNWSSGVDKYVDWLPNTQFQADEIVLYNGDYYRSDRDHITSTVFNPSIYTKLASLSQDGASVISLSPAALGLSLKAQFNVIDDLRDQFNEYEVFKADGFKFEQNFLNYTREENDFTFSPRVGGLGIYGAGFYLVQKEHVILIDNTTQFNDTIYDLEAGYRQERIKVAGYRTVDWYGGFDIPGFIYDQAIIDDWQSWKDYNLGDIVKYKEFYYSALRFLSGQLEFNSNDWVRLEEKPTAELLPNWDYKAEQFTDFYDLESDNFDANQQKIAQHLIGYQKRQYLENIIKNDVSEYKFYQGMIPEKGSVNVLNKLFDVLSAADQESIDFNEEWAVRVGQYGASDAFEEIEFTLDDSLFKTNPQAFELVETVDNSKLDFVIRQTPSQLYLKPKIYTNAPWPVNENYRAYLRTPGYVRYDQVALSVDTLDDLIGKDITTFKEGNYVWCAFENQSWNVYRFTAAEFLAHDVEYSDGVLTIQFDRIPAIEEGDIIGVANADLIQGFHKVQTVILNTITVNVDIPTWQPPFQDSTQVLFYKLTPQRVASIDSDIQLPKSLKLEELLWTDNNGNGKNAVWKNTPVFERKTLTNTLAQGAIRFGRAVATNYTGDYLAVSSDDEEVTLYQKSGSTSGWTKTQTITVPTALSTITGFGETLSFSPDGVWLAVGCPDSNSGEGKVVMYTRDLNGNYIYESILSSPNPAATHKFGSKIKLAYTGSNYRMVVTQPGFNGSQGRVWMYTLYSTWYNESFVETNTTLGDAFGYDIDLTPDGTTLVVSAPRANSTLGKVFVYNNTSSLYELDYTLTSGSTESERFGESVTVNSDGNMIAVGSATYDGTRADQGIVRVYKLTNNWSLFQEIKNRNPEVAEGFGSKLQFINSGRTLVIYSMLGDSITNTTFDVYSERLYPDSTVDGDKYVNDEASIKTEQSTTFDNDATRIATYNRDVGRFDIYDIYNEKFLFAESLTLNNDKEDQYGFSASAGTNTIVTSAPSALNNTRRSGSVYTYVKPEGKFSWTQLQEEEVKIDLKKIKKVFLYNKKSNELITYLDVIDPVQGKIAGVAEQEIKFKTYYDPATYSVGSDAVNVDDGMSWTDAQVGMLWWDLSRAKFLDSYTGDVVYKNSTWNTLYSTASIDIYEWVETKYLPSEWDQLADTEDGLTSGISGTSLYGDNAYSIKRRYDSTSKSFKNTYYFWVKNKTVVPNVIDRRLSAKDVADLIADPKSEGHKFIEFTSPNSFSLVNIDSLLLNSDVVLAVQYWLVDQDDLNIHTDWKIISEHPNTIIPGQIERKWIDSLVGVDDNNRSVPDMDLPPKQKFGVQFRPRQSMFVNRLEAVKQCIERVNSELKKTLIVDSADLTDFQSYEKEPSTISGLYDTVVDTDGELRVINTGAAVVASLTPVIVDGAITDVTIDNPGSGYSYAPYVTIVGNGTGAVIKTKIDTAAGGKITDVEIINKGKGYSSSTTLSVRGLSALVRSDSDALGRWSVYEFDIPKQIWKRTKTQSYNVTNFWNYLDWYATGYNQFTTVDYVVDGTYQLFTLESEIGQIVKVKNVGSAGWMLLEKYANVNSIDYTQSYRVIARQNGTIEISNKFYQYANTNSGYDGPLYDADTFDNSGATELKIILNAIKNKIFIDDLRPKYLELFFASLKFALSEQTFIDWAFKTSFVKAMHNVGALKQKVTYNNDNLVDFENYISEVKPYRTKIREYVSAYNSLDSTSTMITDFDLPAVGRGTNTEPLNVQVKNGTIEYVDSEINQYPWKHWYDNAGFKVAEIVIVDGGSGYIGRPTVTIVGNATTKATARAFVSNGRVTKIEVLTSGSGYLSAPIVEISGGLATGGTPARASAIIKNDLVRSNLIKIKFDRTTRNYFITELGVTEQFTGTASRLQWPLKWSPDLKTGNIIVFVDGQEALRDTYTVTTRTSTTKGYTSYSGLLTFKSAPLAPTNGQPNIEIRYVKDFNHLNAADRINFYYDPQSGQLGKDLTQLMTGVDYGGVNIVGLDFKSSAGWDVIPWFSDVWDGFDPTFDDYIVTVGDSTYTYQLPYTPTVGQQINVYVNGVRIDDLYYDVYDGSTVQPNGRTVAPENAIMKTFVGNGTSSIIELPNLTSTPSLDINTGDQIIFRKSTSDGSSAPSALDYDTALSGGNLAYTSATGLAAEDIIVDGDGFVTPTSSPAPEEVVPGQITDAVAIKVFSRPTNGSAQIICNNFIGDGVTDTFSMGQYPNTQSAIIVKVGANIVENYSIDYDSQTVTLTAPPADKSVVTVMTFGIHSGEDILDLDYFVGDGSTYEFITKAPWTASASSLVVVSGVVENYILFRTDSTYDDPDKIGIRFGAPPSANSIINYLISSGTTRTYSLATKETVTADGSTEIYALNNIIGDSYPYEANVIVRQGNTILSGPNNTYYTMTGNNYEYTIPAHKFQRTIFDPSDFKVYVADGELASMVDYTINMTTGVVTINPLVYVDGGTLIVSDTTTADYFITNDSTTNLIEFVNTPTAGTVFEIMSLYKHDILDIQRSEFAITPTVSLLQNSVEYFVYNQIKGGTLDLGREVTSEDYVWVIKNNSLLAPSIDYKLNPSKTSIKLANSLVANDEVVVMTFSSNVGQGSYSFMQFKDILNRDHYKRINKDKTTVLAKELRYYDKEIYVEDADVLTEPNRSRNIPGVVYIDGERIEYFDKTGNVLSQLRRGTLGTGTPQAHVIGLYVIDIGASETIPYNDDILMESYVHDGSTNIIPLPFTPQPTTGTINDGSTPYTSWRRTSIPSQFGQCDEVDVFIGGYNIVGSWNPNHSYSINEVVIYGSYTYRCLATHISGTDFFDDKNSTTPKWQFFSGNQRLRKHPYELHNVEKHYESPEGDEVFEAEFSVDGTTSGIRLTSDIKAGTKVIVAKKTGRVWNDLGTSLIDSDNKIVNFIKAGSGLTLTSRKA